MLTIQVRAKLATDYGIRDIPHEELVYLVDKYQGRFGTTRPEGIAWYIAKEWQRATR